MPSQLTSNTLIMLLVLIICDSLEEGETPPSTVQPTTIPSTDPTNEPTLEPTPGSSGTAAPTSYPTEIPAKNSFLEIICLQSNDEIIKYNMNLTEDNGFNHNNYGQPRVDDQTPMDSWSLNNIQIPINMNDENMCYLHIYLSNNDYWGYRNNATCTLSYNINTNNKQLNDIKLDLHNILDINQQYNIFWETKFLSNTDYLFGAYPICQTKNGLLDQNIVFSNVDVEDVIDSKFGDIKFETTSNNNNNGEILSSNNGFWPYYFHLSSNQQTNTSQFRIRPAFLTSLGQTCFYDEPLPIYDDKNDSNIKKGGIDYFLFISVYNLSDHENVEILNNLNVNITISQFCNNVDGPSIVETTNSNEPKEGDKNTLNLGVMILIIFGGFFVCMGFCSFLYYCFEDECEEDEYKQTKSGIEMQINDACNNDDTYNDINGENEKPKLDDLQNMVYVISQEDHEEMLEYMRRGSMSIGLQD